MIEAPAAANRDPVAPSAHSGPANPTRTPASGAPMTVARTNVVLSSALARSHRWSGTMLGMIARAPAALSGPVSDDRAQMTSSNAGGSRPAAESPAIVSSPRVATM